MHKIGYARVSTEDKNQTLDSQIERLRQEGCIKIFHEHQTGVWDNRPQWLACLEYLRPGDILVATELSRISRNALMLLQLAADFNKTGLHMKTLDGFIIDTTTTVGKLTFTVMAAIYEFERNMLSDRTRAGLKTARAQGRVGGRPRLLNEERKSIFIDQVAQGKYNTSQVAKAFGISPQSGRRLIREAKAAGTWPGTEKIIMPTIQQLTSVA